MTESLRTNVAIVGAGPAGLMLSHLLHLQGIDSIVLDKRSREDIESTIRAGILENGTVDVLVQSGASDRVLTEGFKHDGIELRFQGEGHRVDFEDLVGRAVWLYPQHEVLKDLIARRLADDGDVRFSVTDVALHDLEGLKPRVTFTDEAGAAFEITADFVVGADGSGGVSKTYLPTDTTQSYTRTYPFAWFGILCEAPMSAPELIYSASERGFALISQRSEDVQRMYFQCDPTERVEDWSDERIWAELQSRVEGTELKEGPIFSKTVLPMRSHVREPMRHGRLFLAGDACHTVPPTGAKGLNLAIADVVVLNQALAAHYSDRSSTLLDAYSETALRRIWKAQHFSWWMTRMLHADPEGSPFDEKRRFGELRSVVTSRAGQQYLAEAYTGWPFELR